MTPEDYRGHVPDAIKYCVICALRWPCQVAELLEDLDETKRLLAESHATRAREFNVKILVERLQSRKYFSRELQTFKDQAACGCGRSKDGNE